MSKKKFSFSMDGKGYYIALILCAVAIGITGYLYYRNTNNSTGNTPDPMASATQPSDDSDVPTVVTTPKNDSTGKLEPEPVPTEGKKRPGQITRPVSGETVAEYAMETLSYNPTTRDWRVHDGIDIAAEAGTQVCAAADGTVYTVYDDDALGMTVVIRHDGGYVTKYSSLSADVQVSAGQTVSCGDVIGTVGSTALLETAIGDHLHFSVSCNGDILDPHDFFSLS